MNERAEDQPEHRLSRRAFARLSAAASIAAMIGSGCREIGSRGVNLRFWNGFTGPDGFTMLKIVKAFNASQDQIQVSMQRTEWATYYNKLFVAGLGGRAPEVFVVQVDSLERFVWGKLLGKLDGLFTGANPLREEDFDANVLAAGRRGATTYGVPLDVHPMGVYYNKRLFADAGIAKAPITRDEFLDTCRRLKKTENGQNQWGFVYEWFRINLYTLLRQWDAQIVSDDYKTVTLDSPQAAEALKFAASLILEEKVASPVENTAAVIGFRQNRVGMIWGGPFLLQDMLKQTDLDFGAAVVPQCGPNPATWAGSHQICIRHDLDEREQAAAATFIKYLSDHSLDWAAAGQVPVRKSLRNTDRFRGMTLQSTFAEQIPYVEYMPSTPFTFEYQTEWDLACESVLRGSKTPQQALSLAATKIRAAIARFDAAAAASRGGAA